MVPSGSFPDWLAHRAGVSPEREALVTGGRSWTFMELDADATRLALELRARGVRPGDRVATLLHNGAAPVLLLHAVLRVGATLVPLNIRLTHAEVAWQLRDAAARFVVLEPRTASLVGDGAASASTADGPRGRALMAFDADDLLRAIPGAAGTRRPLSFTHDASHVLAIIYTSGTTGRPKGAKLSVANAWWSAIGSALNLGTLPSDRWMAVLPLFHVGGLAILLRSAICGFAAVVHESFDAAAVNRSIDEEGVTVVSVVAVMLQRMLDVRDAVPYPPTLRCMLLGGGPASRTLLERCRAMGVPVVQTYGLTETASQLATLPPEDALRKLGSAGRPLYPNGLRISGGSGEVLEAGAEGEIQVRGPVVTPGYAGIEGTTHLTSDGWLRTGDIGRIDEDGFLYVIDRRVDLIISGGENVYPAEVEAALLSHPAIAEAGVVGMPDEQWGQRVVAFVRFTDVHHTDSAEAVREHCRSHLAGYKVPSEVRIVTHELPRTASGKLRRAALRQQAGA